jgi:hypothetical protein
MCFPIQNEAEVHETLSESLISDGKKSHKGGEYWKKARQTGIFCKLTDLYSPWQNRAESEIREFKQLASKWNVKLQSRQRL